MNKHHCLKTIALTTALILTTTLFTPIQANADNQLEEQYQDIQAQIEKKEKELQQKKKEENKAYQELKSINNTLYTVSKQLNTTEANLTKTEKELAILEIELENSEQNLATSTETLSNRLNIIYEQGSVHVLDVLFSSTSITEFLTRWDLLSRLAEQDMGLIDGVKAEIKQFQDKQNQVLVKKNTLSQLLAEQEGKKQQLNSASSRQKELYNSISLQRKDVERALDELDEESARIADMLRRLSGDTANLGTGKFTWPSPGYKRITSQFGNRRHPILKTPRFHSGVDIGVPMSSTIVAADSGTVIETAWRGAYGNTVLINHGNGTATMYAHLSKFLVKAGTAVKKGDAIAKSGSTGWSTGPHLHFEVRVNGNPVNPLNYIK